MKFLALCVLVLSLPLVHALTYEHTDDPNLVNRCFLSESDYRITQPIRVTKLGNVTVTEIEPTPATPSYDDLLYGQLLNNRGEPWGGQTVRITWRNNGEEKSLTTTTLTIEEARLFGDPLFEGYYFFSKKRVGDAEYTVEVIEETTTPVTTPEPTQPTQEPEPEPIITPTSQPVVKEKTPNPLIIFFSDFWKLFASIASIVIIISLYQWRFKKSFDKFFFRPPKISRSVAVLNKKPARTFMKTDLPLLDVDSSIRDLLTVLLQEEYALIITEGRFLGLVTSEDIVKPLYNKPAHELRIKDLLIHPRTIIPATPFGEVSMLATEYHVLPVIKNGVCVGVVERKKILSMYDELYSLNPAAVRKVAKLQHALQQAATIHPGANVKEVVEKMISSDVSMIIVADDKAQSIVSEKEIVQELMDYRDTLEKIQIDVFGTRLVTTEATSSLLDANRLMLDNNLRAIPVTHKGLLVGILTQRAVLHELYFPLKEYA